MSNSSPARTAGIDFSCLESWWRVVSSGQTVLSVRGSPVLSPVMFLSCCCPSGRKENKKRKASSGGQSSCPASPHYQPHYQPHSPIFTIQSQPTNIQSDSLSSEDFYYYQVALSSALPEQ